MSVLPRTAVVVVHGIGEQKPLSTLLNFAGLGERPGGVLVPSEDDTHWYVQPDTLSGRTYSRLISYDQQHLVPIATNVPKEARSTHYARTTHFFEYYWAYRFRDTTWRHLTGWIGRLVTMKHADVTQPNLRGLTEKRTLRNFVVVSLLMVTAATTGLAVGDGSVSGKGPNGIIALVMIGLATLSAVAALGIGGQLGLITTIHIALGIALAAFVGFVGAGYWVLDISSWHRPSYGLGAAAFGVSCLSLAIYAARLPEKKPAAPSIANTSQSVLQLWWLLLLVMIVACLVAGSWGALAPGIAVLATVKAIVPVVLALVAPLLTGFALRGVGDAARYLSNHADDVTEREKVRQGLIDLLRGLHEKTDPVTKRPAYERVILVGHSLGSVIAYDALTAYWAQVNQGLVFPEEDASRTSERAALISSLEAHPYVSTCRDSRVLPYDPTLVALHPVSTWTAAQRRLQTSLASIRRLEYARAETSEGEHKAKFVPTFRRWIVTDLVTLGSPLTYAEVLLASGTDGVRHARERRLITSNPPATQRTAYKPSESPERPTWFRYRPWRGSGRGYTTKLHHGAVFAATTWTNMYFADDLVGGPLAPYFGMGVDDRIVQSDEKRKQRNQTLSGALTTVGGFLRHFPHTSYWIPSKKANENGNTEVVTFLRGLIRRPRTVVVVSGSLHAAEIFRQRVRDNPKVTTQPLHDPGKACDCREAVELRYLHRRKSGNDGEEPIREWLWLDPDWVFGTGSLAPLIQEAAECGLKVTVAGGKPPESTEAEDTADDDAYDSPPNRPPDLDDLDFEQMEDL